MTEDELKTDAESAPRFLAETMSGFSLRSKLELAAAALILLAAVMVWAIWPAKPVPEVITAAPQVVQADHSLVVARDPEAHPVPPPHMLPKGSVEVRREKIVAAPAAGASSVEVDLSLVRVDGGQRVVASSPDGTISTAIDIPIEQALIPAPPKPWAAGLSYGTGRSVGLWIDRDIGRLVLGAAVQRLQDGHAEAQVRVGVRF